MQNPSVERSNEHSECSFHRSTVPFVNLFGNGGSLQRRVRAGPARGLTKDGVDEVAERAAHGTEDGEGALLEVEPGELDALFAALDDFFDTFYVKLKRHQEAMAAIDRKISEAAAKRSVS